MTDQERQIADDVRTLQHLGYKQELRRGMSGFSNFAISLSIICILSGGLTSFHLGLCSVGGAAIGLGWPLVAAFSLIVALTMAQVASAFPTAGGLYHWASILGGRGWGWLTAWLNLIGLVTVLAAINVGTHQFLLGCLGPLCGFDAATLSPETAFIVQSLSVIVITVSQGLFNHLGIRLTTRLTDFSGYLIMIVAAALTVALLVYAPRLDFSLLVNFTNYSGRGPDPEHPVWLATTNVPWLFCLSFLLPAYTLTGFDASAHTAEETIGAAHRVPRGIVRSVLVSSLFGWVMLCAIVVACPNMEETVNAGGAAFFVITSQVLPFWLLVILYVGIVVAQYLCGLATLTSASRMTFAFARDGGLPGSQWLKRVHVVYQTPVPAIWSAAALTLFFVLAFSVYSTLTAICAIFLYLSYVIPTALGFWAYGRSWTQMGPWHLGRWYRPLAIVCVLGCALLLAIGCYPPNETALPVVGVSILLLLTCWFCYERNRFQGPPNIVRTPEKPVK